MLDIAGVRVKAKHTGNAKSATGAVVKIQPCEHALIVAMNTLARCIPVIVGMLARAKHTDNEKQNGLKWRPFESGQQNTQADGGAFVLGLPRGK